MKRKTKANRLLHNGELQRCFRYSLSVTYKSAIPSNSTSAPCISSILQSLPNQLRKEENFECTRVHDKLFLPEANDKISNS
ncbi:hypothetical protein ACFO3G_00595 [Falsiporphyromonas endometrii]|uniref:Uncharacterized protein n=1 Tax=Falsiporphyromonas endometrii TaxID=1387297 RepID=A0ABV9K4X1_9PORP